MKSIRYVLTAFLVTAFAAVAVPSMAQDPMEKAVKARQGNMQLRAWYIGTLGGMAKEKIPYDAEKAQAAADNLLAVINLDSSGQWPQGSDSKAMPGKSWAKVEAWTTYPESAEKGKVMKAAATAMAAAAGNGLGELQGAIGALGKSCGGCHKPFRQKKE